MSKVVIQGDANGTGIFTVTSPNSNTDRTLTLPDAAGTMMLTDTGVTTAQMPAGSVLQIAKGESTTTVSFSTVQTYFVLYSFDITAVGDNSRYVFNTYQPAYHSTASLSSRGNVGYSVTIGGTTTRLAGVDGASGDSWGMPTYTAAVLNRVHVWDSSVSAGTTITVNVLGANFDPGTISFNLSGYNLKGFCTVTEVAV